MGFSSRLSQLMQENNLSDRALAESIGVSRQAVAKWRNGSVPAYDKVSKLAEYFGVPLQYFYQDITNPEYIRNVIEEGRSHIDCVRIPIAGSIRAGYPIESFEDYQGYVVGDYPSNENLFALNVVGDSMMPLVMDGDIIVCNKKADHVNGKICAVTIDNESTLKRVKTDSTGVTLIPTNPMYPELHYSAKKAEELGFRVDGVLVQMIRNF